MNAYGWLAVAIGAEVIATSALKASAGFTRWPPLAIVLIGYAVAFFCLSRTLDAIPVGVAYAIWSAAGIVLISSVGWVLYGERLDAAALLGIGLIIAGVLVVNLLSKTTAH